MVSVTTGAKTTSDSRRDKLLATLTIADFKEACRRERSMDDEYNELALEQMFADFDKELAIKFWEGVMARLRQSLA